MKYFDVFFTSLRLGLTSFGGPVAHLSYFHNEYVKKKKWISEHAFTDLVVLCQFLPGPASSQVGMAIGFSRAGIWGSILAWFGFTLPSAVLLVLFGLSIRNLDLYQHQQWIHGLKVVAVSVVAQAVFEMGKKFCPDKERIALAVISCAIILLVKSALIQISVLLIAGIIGAFFLKKSNLLPHEPFHQGSQRVSGIFLIFYFAFLLFLPLLRPLSQEFRLIESFYRAGALVFGGGHVVLPLLQAEVVPTGWVTNDLFMTGYGIANAIPGPLFSFTAYLGAVSSKTPNGITGAIICLVAAFLPSFLLIIGALPLWEKIRNFTKIRQSMVGVNASVVGLLLAALYEPVFTSAIFTSKDFLLALIGFILLDSWKLPSWSVIIVSVALSFYIY